jgi:hypothetical protein
VKSIPSIIKALVNGFKAMWSTMSKVGLDLIKGIWQGIQDAAAWLKQKITEWVGNVVNFIKRLFGIKSPSKVMADQVGRFLPMGLAEGIADNAYLVDEAMDDMMQGTARTAEIAASVRANGQSIGSGAGDGDIYALLYRYLPILAANSRTNVVLEGDASAIFKSVKEQARTYKRATGLAAFG